MVRLKGRHDFMENVHLVGWYNVFAKFLLLSGIRRPYFLSCLRHISPLCCTCYHFWFYGSFWRWGYTVQNFLSLADFFAKYTADFAVLFATRHSSYSSLLFKPFFRSFQNLRLNLTALSTESCHHQASFCLGAPFVHPQVLSQASRRQDLISSQQSFTYFLLKFCQSLPNTLDILKSNIKSFYLPYLPSLVCGLWQALTWCIV